MIALAGCLVLSAAIFGIGAQFTPHYAVFRAERALQARDNEAALHWLERAQAIDPRRAQTQFLLARTHRRLGQFDAVREHLARAGRLGHPVEDLRREQWLALAQSGQIAETEPHLSGLLMTAGDDGRDICEAFVHGYCTNLQFGPAQQLLDAWQADFPVDPEPHFRRGFIQQATHDLESAVTHYRRGLSLGPHRSDARVRLGQCLLSLNRPAEAEDEFRERLSDDPDDTSALVGLAEALSAQRRVDEARSVYRTVVAIDAEHFEARSGLAQLALQSEDPGAAVRLLQPLAQERPYSTATLNALAQAYAAIGDQASARRLLETVRKAEEHLSRLETLVEEAVHRPDDAEVRYEVGMILMRHGPPDDGARWLRSVLQLDARHAGAHGALAEYYAQRGDERQAERHRRAGSKSVEHRNEG